MFKVMIAPEIKGLYGIRLGFDIVSDNLSELEDLNRFHSQLIEELSPFLSIKGNGGKVEFKLGFSEATVKEIVAIQAKSSFIDVIWE